MPARKSIINSVPKILTIADLSKSEIRDQIKLFVDENPSCDHIYTFKGVNEPKEV
jgi:hypothetical protein